MDRGRDVLGPCVYVLWHDYDWSHPLQCNASQKGIKIHWNPAAFCILATVHGISLYITLELVVQTLRVFRRWKTLYFWSLLFVCLGQAVGVLAVDLGIFVLPPTSGLLLALNLCAIILLPSAFTLVLYSRLYLVMPPQRQCLRRILLGCIVAIDIGVLSPQAAAAVFVANNTTEKTLQLQKLTLLIAIILMFKHVGMICLYIYFFRCNWMADLSSTPTHIRRFMVATYYQLIVFCAIIIVSKSALYYMLVKDLLLLRSTVMSITYSMMLVFELSILDRILKISKLRVRHLREGNLWMDFRSEGQNGRTNAGEKCSHIASEPLSTGDNRARVHNFELSTNGAD